MQLPPFPFSATDWDALPAARLWGERGWAEVRIQCHADVCIRLVDYSPGYVADHWCDKGQVAVCLEGYMETELRGGTRVGLHAGMTAQVGDRAESRRVSSLHGARVLLID